MPEYASATSHTKCTRLHDTVTAITLYDAGIVPPTVTEHHDDQDDHDHKDHQDHCDQDDQVHHDATRRPGYHRVRPPGDAKTPGHRLGFRISGYKGLGVGALRV